MCCSVMVYSSVYSEWSFAGPCPRTWRGIQWLPNLRSGCIVLQMSWSHSNQIPALAKSTSGPPSDPRCPHWQAVETQNPNDCPLSIDPQLLPSVSLVWSHLPAPLQMAGEPCWNQGRSVCTLLFFGYAWQSPGAHWPREKGEMSFLRFHIFNRWPRIRLPSCPLIRWQCTCHPRIYRSWAPRTTL